MKANQPLPFTDAGAFWPGPRVIAHRGGGTLAPENTLAALRAGHAAGCGGVEFDVMLSADGVPLLMHDADFGRTVAGCGYVADTPAAQILAMDAGAWFGAPFRGERVPTLAQALARCVELGLWMNIEIKPAHEGVADATGAAVARAVLETPAALAMRPVLSSFSEVALAAAQRIAPELARGLLVEAIPPDWPARVARLGAATLHAHHPAFDSATLCELNAAMAAGAAPRVGLLAYTVNDPAEAARLTAAGVAVCTDRPDLIRAG